MEAEQPFLENVVKALVDKPQAVSVEKGVDEMGVLLTPKSIVRARWVQNYWRVRSTLVPSRTSFERSSVRKPMLESKLKIYETEVLESR
jgi:hypothetical protein